MYKKQEGSVKKMISLKPKETILQNLKDAGCTRQMIENFMIYFDKNQKEKQLALLAVQRQELLNKVHVEEKKISCLDYLIYQIEK